MRQEIRCCNEEVQSFDDGFGTIEQLPKLASLAARDSKNSKSQRGRGPVTEAAECGAMKATTDKENMTSIEYTTAQLTVLSKRLQKGDKALAARVGYPIDKTVALGLHREVAGSNFSLFLFSKF